MAPADISSQHMRRHLDIHVVFVVKVYKTFRNSGGI